MFLKLTENRSMNRTIYIVLMLGFSLVGFCQQAARSQRSINGELRGLQRSIQPGQQFPDFPRLSLPKASRTMALPPVVDNSGYPWLRNVFRQEGASCGQAASVAYNFCYEINRLRGLPSDTSANLYPSHFTWNFMNGTLPYYGEGVNYFHTFDILYDAGCPTEDIYGPIVDDSYRWMDGYEGYYQAMHNRISGAGSIYVANPEGLLTLKHWLHNHLNGSLTGGVANYMAGLPYYGNTLPEGTPEAGKTVQIELESLATHALTIVGYNDSVRYDVNGDGQFTNHLDITNDGITDMRDWEIGALKFVNSYGNEWADSGFCYLLYRTLALRYGEGGIWNNSVTVVYPDTAYSPLLTAKIKMSHNKRGRIRVSAGISTDTAHCMPAHTLSFSLFNYQGLDYPLSGYKTPDGKNLEFGLDLTPLLSYVEPGKGARIMLIVDEDDPDSSAEGKILWFSVIRYHNGDSSEYPLTGPPVTISDNDQTIVSVVLPSVFEPLSIQPGNPLVIEPGQPGSRQLFGTGGVPPLNWQLSPVYHESEGNDTYIEEPGIILTPSDPHSGYAAVALPFEFPYFGNTFDTLYMHVNGYLMFEPQDMPYYYLLFDDLYLRQVSAVAPFMNHNMGIRSAGDGLSVVTTSDKVSFFWKISEGENLSHTSFSATIYPDGKISFHYGPGVTVGSKYPVIGISNGTRQTSLFSEWSGLQTPEGQIVNFSPSKIPDGFTISEEGLLEVPGTPGLFSGELLVKVSDSRRVTGEKKLLVTSGPEILLYPQNPAAKPFPGAVVPLTAEIKNHGTDRIENLTVGLHTASNNCSVGGQPVLIPFIEPGQSAIFSDSFSLLISDTISFSQPVKVKLWMDAGTSMIEKFESFQVNLPLLDVLEPTFDDGLNFTADPGEQAPLVFTLLNKGNASAGFLTARIALDSPYAVIAGQPEDSIGELKGFGSRRLSFPMKLNEAAPNGRFIEVRLTVLNTTGIIFEESYKIPCGMPEILLSDADKNHNSAIHLAETLRALDIMSEITETIGPAVSAFEYNFIFLGHMPNHFTTTAYEDSLLAETLHRGKSLYLEGGSFFRVSQPTELRTLLHVDGEYYGWQSRPDTLSGLVSTPVEGIRIDYRGDWLRTDNLVAVEPAVPWFRNKDSELDFVAAIDSGSYRAISSSIEFGGIFPYDGPGRNEILTHYLEFLGFEMNPLSAVFSASSSSSICKGNTVAFGSVCSSSPDQYLWTFDGGNPHTWEGPDPVIRYDSTGFFGVSLKITKDNKSNTFSLSDLVEVADCLSTEKNALPGLVLYPNPAGNSCMVKTSGIDYQIDMIVITDLQGREILRHHNAEAAEQISLNTTDLAPGLYVVNAMGKQWKATTKLIRL